MNRGDGTRGRFEVSDSTELAVLGTFNEVEIAARPSDQFVNATAMCKATGKLWADYWRQKNAIAFVEALSLDMGIPISNLVWEFRGKPSEQQGTWVHRRVAIHLAQWCSPEFSVWVSGRIEELMTTGRTSIVREHTEAKLEKYFEAQTAVLLGIKDQLQAIPIVVQRQEKLETEVGILGQRLERFESNVNVRFDDIQKRKDLTAETKARHTAFVHARFKGCCPKCGDRVLNDKGERLPHARFDHAVYKHLASIDKTWLVCNDCNQSFNDQNRRAASKPCFEMYQGDLRDYEDREKYPLYYRNQS